MNCPYLDGKSQMTDWRCLGPRSEAELQTIYAGYWLLQQNPESALHGLQDDWSSVTTLSSNCSEQHTNVEDEISIAQPFHTFNAVTDLEVSSFPDATSLDHMSTLDCQNPRNIPWYGYRSFSRELPQFELYPDQSDSIFQGMGQWSGSMDSFPLPANLLVQETSVSTACQANPGNVPSLQLLQCKWPDCSGVTYFINSQEYRRHIKSHEHTVRKNWDPKQPCSWHECPSAARYATFKMFEQHINNFHVNPLLCPVKYCKLKTPFRGQYELTRHIANTHDKLKHPCPYQDCYRSVKEFPRKDKLLHHLRVCHNTEPCPYAHCREDCPDSISKHVGKTHGRLECGLDLCHGKISRFLDNALLDHLEFDHAMDRALSMQARDRAKVETDGILRPRHISKSTQYRGCVCCKK